MTIELCDNRKRLLETNGNLIILGGPGSGKTTIALIKSSKEIEKLLPGQKILFLSFARATVARVLESALEHISKNSSRDIEINTYHGFFWNILKSHGYLLNKNVPIKLISPSDAAVEMAHIKSEDRDAEFNRLFEQEGRLGFDLFATTTKELLARSRKLLRIISSAYPVIIVDEFQDTNVEEWEIIKLFGRSSRIIALADADQRIYEFRGADPARIGEFLTHFTPESFDFGLENNRSGGTDINIFGNDLLTGTNKSKTYNDVDVIYYPYYKTKHEMFALKTNLLNAIRRLKDIPRWSVAVLVPTRRQMLLASNYLSSQKDGLPSLEHDVAIDAEGPSLAGAIIAKLLEKFNSEDEIKKQIIQHLVQHLKGRKGSSPPVQADYSLAITLEKYLKTSKITGARRQKLIHEIEVISKERFKLRLVGSPWEDWFSVLGLFFSHAVELPLVNVREDARYVRLLHKGSYLRETLNSTWREYGYYFEAGNIFLETLQQEFFSSTVKKLSGINVMTIHKSKGKQFNEVFLFEGYRQGRFSRVPTDKKQVDQSKLMLRVAVTRAMNKTTILSPSGNRCELL